MTVGCSTHSRASAKCLRGLTHATGLLTRTSRDHVHGPARQCALAEQRVMLCTCLPRKTR